ncbi:hypothetical protein D1872_51570 [compost metagenome]
MSTERESRILDGKIQLLGVISKNKYSLSPKEWAEALLSVMSIVIQQTEDKKE